MPADVSGNDWRTLDVAPLSQFKPSLSVTVVIPYYEAPDALNLTLAALERQSYPRELFDVVVVDDGSRIPLQQPVDTSLDVKVVHQEDRGFGLARARNTGVRASSGDVVVFLDCDMMPESDWLVEHSRWHHVASDVLTLGFRAHVDVAGIDVDAVLQRSGSLGDLFVDRPQQRPEWIEFHMTRTGNLTSGDDDLFRVVTGGNLGVSRVFFEQVGCYDETFTQWGTEDTEFGYRAFTLGALLVPVRSALCWHQGAGASPSKEESQSLELQRAKISQLIAHHGFRSNSPGRSFTVPQFVVTVRSPQTDFEAQFDTVEQLLANTVHDLIVWVEEPEEPVKPEESEESTDPPEEPVKPEQPPELGIVDVEPGPVGDNTDPDPDFERFRRLFAGDPRVRFGSRQGAAKAIPAAAFHITIPTGVEVNTHSVAKMRRELGLNHRGVVELANGHKVEIIRARSLHKATRCFWNLDESYPPVHLDPKSVGIEVGSTFPIKPEASIRKTDCTQTQQPGMHGKKRGVRGERLKTRARSETPSRFKTWARSRTQVMSNRWARSKTQARCAILGERLRSLCFRYLRRFKIGRVLVHFFLESRRAQNVTDTETFIVKGFRWFVRGMAWRIRWVAWKSRRVASVTKYALRGRYQYCRKLSRATFRLVRMLFTDPKEFGCVLKRQIDLRVWIERLFGGGKVTPTAEYRLGAKIMTIGTKAEAVLAVSSCVIRSSEDPEAPEDPLEVEALVADTSDDVAKLQTDGFVEVAVLSGMDPRFSVPAFDIGMWNPIDWIFKNRDYVVTLGPKEYLPNPERVRRSVRPYRRKFKSMLYRFAHHVEDVAEYHADVLERSGTLVSLAATGAVVHINDGNPRLRECLGAELYSLMTDKRILTSDRYEREAFSIAMRRSALREHSLRARVRQLFAGTGLMVPSLPTVSVLLATRRPGRLSVAVDAVISQTYPDIELVLALHGDGFQQELESVRRKLEKVDFPVHVVSVEAHLPLGAVLNAAVAESTGKLITMIFMGLSICGIWSWLTSILGPCW